MLVFDARLMSRLQLCNWTSLDFVNSTWHSLFGKPINHLNIIDGASNAHFFCPWIDSQATVLTRSHCIFPLKYAMFVHVYIIHFWDVLNGLTTSLMRWNPLFWWWNNHTSLSIHPKLKSMSLDFHHQKTLDFTIKNLGDILNSLQFHHLRSLFRTSLGGSATAGLALFHALRRRTKHRAAARLTRRSAAQPIFCSVLSSQGDWRAAVAELVAEATYQLLEENCWKMMVKMWCFF